MLRIVEKPEFYPYVCISCGVNYDRRWYVVLDFSLEIFNPLHHGQIMLCNECWTSTAIQVSKSANEFLRVSDNLDAYVEPTFDNETKILEGVQDGPESVFFRSGITAEHSDATESGDATDSDSTEHDRTTEPDNQPPTISASPDDPTSDDTEESDLRTFRAFFGDPAKSG